MKRCPPIARSALLGVLALAAPAAARAPTAAERALVGQYYVGDGLDHRLCRIVLDYEPTVGGEAVASGCAKTAPALADAARWWVDPARGGPTFADPLRKVVASFADSEAGLIANDGDDRILTLEPVTAAFARAPGAELPGRWAYENAGGDDPTGGCTVRFANAGTLTVAPHCPAALRAAGARWHATTTTVALAQGGKRLALAWGASSDTLFLPGGAFRLVRKR